MAAADDVVDDETVAVLGATIDWSWEQIRKLPRAEVPRLLQPMLGFRRLSPSTRRQILRALDDDGDLRERVAGDVETAPVPALGILWLRRPQGWRDRFDDLAASAREKHHELSRVAEEARLQEELERVQAALTKVTDERDSARELAEKFRREAEESRSDLSELRRERNTYRDAATQLEEERHRAVRELQDAKRLAERRLEELRALQASNRTEVDERDGRGEVSGEPRADQPAIVAESLRDATEELRSALVGDLRRVFDDAVEMVNRELVGFVDEVLPAGRPNNGERLGAEVPGTAATPNHHVKRRRPLRLPGGILDDEPEAANYLLEHADVWLIDGYNVSMAKWAGAAVHEQRAWLLQRVNQLKAGARVQVIFDGVGEDPVRTAGARHQRVGVTIEFSPQGVEADDVIIDRCSELPPSRSIAVVSNDQRVRSGARQAGANLVTVEQFFAISGSL